MHNQAYQPTIDLDAFNQALAAAAARRDYLLQVLQQFAARSAEGAIIAENELDNGQYLVARVWPTKFAYLDYAFQGLAMEATLKTPTLTSS